MSIIFSSGLRVKETPQINASKTLLHDNIHTEKNFKVFKVTESKTCYICTCGDKLKIKLITEQ